MGQFFRTTLRVLVIAVACAFVLFSVLSRTSIFIPRESELLSSIFLAITRIGTFSFNLVTLLSMLVFVVALVLDARLDSHSILSNIVRLLSVALVAGGFVLSFNAGRSTPPTEISVFYNIGVSLVLLCIAMRAALMRLPLAELAFFDLWTFGTWLALYDPVSQQVYQLLGQFSAPPGIQYTTFVAEAMLVLALAVAHLAYWWLPLRAEGSTVDAGAGWRWSLMLALIVPVLLVFLDTRLPGVTSLITKFAVGYNLVLPWLIYAVVLGLLLFTLLRLAFGGASRQRYQATGLFFLFASGFQQLDSYHYTLMLLGLVLILRARDWSRLTHSTAVPVSLASQSS